MDQLSETARVDRELEQARLDLRETLEQVNHKIANVEARLRPEAILRRNPIALPLMGALLGFLAGNERHWSLRRWLAIGAVVGILAAAPRGRNGTSE